MSKRKSVGWSGLASCAAVLLLAATAGPALAQAHSGEPPLPLDLTAFAVNPNAGGGSGRIEIHIERWSSDAETQRLKGTLEKKGTEQLYTAIQDVKPRVGYIRTDSSLAWDLKFARWRPGEDGGWDIVFATDRPMRFWELRNQTRSADYEFMTCEIRIPPTGKGEGMLAPLARITYNKKTNQIEVENWAVSPVSLNEIEVSK
jgi:hypothetical protein